MPDEFLATRIVRALREGIRESLTLASALGVSVTRVNEALHLLQVQRPGCLELIQPYPDEPRLVVTVLDWRSLRQSVAEDVPTTFR